MRILFDQCAPLPLRDYLAGHVVSTAAKQGWTRLVDGDLLIAAENNGFDVLVTADKNLYYQQNLKTRKIAIVVLGRQQWPALLPHVNLVARAVNAAVPGSYVEVSIPK